MRVRRSRSCSRSKATKRHKKHKNGSRILCALCASLWLENFGPLVNHDSYSDSEVVLRTVKQSRRVVINLNNPDVNPITRTNVDAAAKRTGKSRFRYRVIYWTRAGRDCDTNEVVDVQAIASMRSTHEGMSEWLERCF